MKNIIIIGAGLAIILIAVLSWRHFRHPSDAAIRQEVGGSWTGKNPKFKMTIAPDGGFAFGTSPNHDSVSGTWEVSDGLLTMTVTNSTAHGGQSLIGGHMRCKISRLDDHQLVYELDGNTTILSR